MPSSRPSFRPTYTPKPGDTTRSWYVIDATDVVLGQLAVAAANLLRGKHKPTFTPNVDVGDFVIIVNADKIAVGGDKLNSKMSYQHSGYPGGLRTRTLGELLRKQPDRVVEKAIVGMLPKNRLSRQIQRKLKVYAGPDHPHSAQRPVNYEIKQVVQ
ncbi:MAG: 50S ribosomal protein L13 [Mycobacterium sp.]